MSKWRELHEIIDGVDHKICNKCGDAKPSNEEYFYRNKKNSIDGLYPYCILCAISSAAIYQEDNKENKLAYARKYNNRPDIKEINKVYKKDYRDKGKQTEWGRNNTDKLKIYGKNKKHKTHTITAYQWDKCKRYFNNTCAYCGLHIDEHYVPRKGVLEKHDLHKEHVDDQGPNDLSNCIPSCNSCNSQKWTFSLDFWYSSDNSRYSIDRLNKIHKWLEVDYKLYVETL